MSSFEIQVFVSLIVVLGAAFVALICDYLKGNNERLRERNEELQARVAEREMLETLIERFQSKTLDAAMQAQKEALRELLDSSTPGRRALSPGGVAALPEARAVGAPPAAAAAARRIVAKRQLETGTSKDSPSPVIEWPVPPAEGKDRPVLPVENEPYQPAFLGPVAPDRSERDRKSTDDAAAPGPGRAWSQPAAGAAMPRTAQPIQAPPPPFPTKPTVRVFQMTATPEESGAPAALAPARKVVPEEQTGELEIPAGHFEAAALKDLLAGKGAFRGLVVFISVVATGQLATTTECPEFTRLLNSVSRSLLALRRSEDLSCRSAENEFVLIYPRETGVSAQRIIARVKENLYDLQLRSLGAFSARFVWGAAESTADARLADLLSTARAQAQDFLKA